jgi:hypothetical protein
MAKGSCLCGAVSIRIEGPIRNARYCHCTNCRKFSGTAYAAWGLVETDHLEISPKEPKVSKFSSQHGRRVFCTTCGSPLWFEPASLPQFRGIPLGVIDGDGVGKPEMHVWTKSKVAWAPILDDLPQFEMHP